MDNTNYQIRRCSKSLLEAVAKVFEGQPVQTVLILSECFPNTDENDWLMSITMSRKNKKIAWSSKIYALPNRQISAIFQLGFKEHLPQY